MTKIKVFFRQALQILDKTANICHHCSVLTEFSFLSWEQFN